MAGAKSDSRSEVASPPPLWQVWLSIAIGVASVFGALAVLATGVAWHVAAVAVVPLVDAARADRQQRGDDRVRQR